MIVGDISLDRHGHRVGGTEAVERAALELLVAGFDALVYRWMKLDGHELTLASLTEDIC